MSIAKIQSGDMVKVIAGNYKGTIGQVTKVVKKQAGKVEKVHASISTVPKIVKFRRKTTFQNQNYAGSRFETDRLIDVSNLSLITSQNQVSRVGIRTGENGKKERFLKKDQSIVIKSKISQITNKEESK